MRIPSQSRPFIDVPHADDSFRTMINEGTWIGKFRILGELGRGGMGVVYEAHDSLLDRAVAIKVLPRTLNQQAASIQRFLQEARSVARINHPHIVAVYDADQFQGQYYIVLELVRGRNLMDVIRTKPLNWIEATRILADACRGLVAAHDMGVVHRDIKPSNLIQSDNGCVKLADFGLVRMLEPNGQKPTVSGCLLGTPEFMSPEQCRSELADVRSDIYSMGATYFSMLTGHPPFDGIAPLLVMNAHLWSAIPDPREFNASVPETCGLIIRRAMAKNPEDRYQDATDLLNELDVVLRSTDAISAIDRSVVTRPATLSAIEGEQNETSLTASFDEIRDLSWGLPQRSGGAHRGCVSGPPEPLHEPIRTLITLRTSVLQKWRGVLLSTLAFAFLALSFCPPGSSISPHFAHSTAMIAAIASVADGGESDVSESALSVAGIQIPGLKRDPLRPPTDVQSWSMDYPGIQSLCAAASGEFLVVLSARLFAFSPTQASRENSTEPGRIQVWSREGKSLVDQMLDGPGTAAVLSSDDRLLAVGRGNGKAVQLWDAKTWKPIAEIPIDAGSRVDAIAFSNDNHWLVFTSVTDKRTNSRVIWDLQKQELVRAETTTGPDPFCAAVFQRGAEPIVQTCTQSGIVETWANSQSSFVAPILRTGASVNAVAFSQVGDLVAAGMGPYFAIWNRTDTRREHAVNNVLADVQCIAFSASGREVCWAAGSAVQCLNVKSKRPITSLSTRGGHVVSMAVRPNAAGIWAACDDGKLIFWSTPTQETVEVGTSNPSSI